MMNRLSKRHKPILYFKNIMGSFNNVDDYLRADNAEDKSYESTKDDPKWQQVLIDEDRKWTRKQIRDHYMKYADKILKEISGKPIMIYVNTGKTNQNVLRRKLKDKPIVINNKEEYIKLVDGRLLSIHRVFGPKTDLGFVDLDVHEGFSQDKTKQYAKRLAKEIKSKYGATATIYDSGGTGYHVEFGVKDKNVNTLRNELRELCEDLNEDFDGFTAGIVKGPGVRTDTTTLKNLGNLRVPYALHEKYGGIKKPIGSKNASKNPFLSKRAKPEKPSFGVFNTLPAKIAKQFKSLGEHDDSKPHITILYIGKDVPKNKRGLLEDTVKDVLENQEPFEVKLDDKVTYFPATEHSDNCKVAKMNVVSKDLRALHKKLKEAMSDAGIKVDDHFPDYKPHVTLEYMEPPKKKYDDKVPSGSWTVDSAEMWGVKNKTFKLGPKQSISKRAKDPLAKYKSKRDFDETKEPEGKVSEEDKNRFVIQDHNAEKAGRHFDLRLEHEGVLESWSVPKHRLPKGKERLLAVQTESHPIEYVSFKGIIPAGEYGAGKMDIFDKGTYKPIEYTNKKILFEIPTGKAKGKWILVKTDGKNWLFMREQNG